MTTETQRKCRIMALMLEATRSKALRWNKADLNRYAATAGEHAFSITFKYPLLANDDGSDADVAEVGVPGRTFTFYNGTEGFDAALQILEEGDPDRMSRSAGFANRADAAIGLLESLTQGPLAANDEGAARPIEADTG